MKELQQRELTRLIAFLDAIDCQYKIITNDGQTFWRGNVDPPPKISEKKKRNLSMPYGTIAAYYKPYINLQAKVGEVIEVPVGTFDRDVLRGAVCSYLTKNWGKKSYTSMVTKESVQVMKTEEPEECQSTQN